MLPPLVNDSLLKADENRSWNNNNFCILLKNIVVFLIFFRTFV